MGSRPTVAAALLVGLLSLGSTTRPAVCSDKGAASSPDDLESLQELQDLQDLLDLYMRRDMFSLRARLAKLREPPDGPPPEIRFLQAAVQLAFNEPIDALRTLELFPVSELPLDLASEAQYLELLGHLRLHSYGPALAAARSFLRKGDQGNPTRDAEVRGLLPLLLALADAPPQSAEIRKPSRLILGRDGRIPLRIEGAKLRLALDSGANFSVLRHGETVKLGLTVRPAGVKVATATGSEVLADVALAEHVEIGNVSYRNVVFLVFPDEALDLPRSGPISGLVGFPLVEAMGEVRFRHDGVMEVPSRPSKRSLGNLALDNLDPLVRLRWEKENLICRLDTGAAQSVFYEPFFRRHRDRLESYGRQVSVPVSGVGGVRELPAYRLPKILLTLAGAGFALREVDVYTVPVRPLPRNYLDCNVGLDVLGRFRAYVINFREMSLILE